MKVLYLAKIPDGGFLVENKYKMFASKMRADLYRNLKLLSAAEGRSIKDLLEAAVTEYLEKHKFSKEEHHEGDTVVKFFIERSPDHDR